MHSSETHEPTWKKLKLSLERPYKDDDGNQILPLLDVLPDGQQIHESPPDPHKVLAESIRRIFLERGYDFFDKRNLPGQDDISTDPTSQDLGDDEEIAKPEHSTKPMTPEELFKMRTEILPRLDIAFGEMSEARNLLLLLLSSVNPGEPSPIPTLPPSALGATTVTKPAPILSVQSFDAQLVVGGKDESLRKASSLFKVAAESMEQTRAHDERYWANALKIRKQNWGLLPAPLPFGSATGKGADKTSKDFLVSFGMEGSPAAFRRRAIGHMATWGANTSSALVFPHRQHTRLRITYRKVDPSGSRIVVHSRVLTEDETSLQGSLRAAQLEVVEQEIFSILIREASSLPTASARVSERLIVIEAAHQTELTFELVDNSLLPLDAGDPESEGGNFYGVICNLIYATLHVLLIRAHAYEKAQRLDISAALRSVTRPPHPVQPPLILQTIIDLIQYQVFCERVKVELDKIMKALLAAGIPTIIRFNAVGDCGEYIVKLVTDNTAQRVGGDAILRIDERHSLRFTFLSPSTLMAHLPQATLAISSIPQLCQLLNDEVERFVLNRICEIGTEACESVNGTWFLDSITSRSVGRWEGNVLDFRISFAEDRSIRCIAFTLDGTNTPITVLDKYETSMQGSIHLLSWVQRTVALALTK